MKLSQIVFFALVVLLPSQLGRHFWPEWTYIWGLKVDYLSPTLYLTDILAMVMLVVWGWEEKLKVRSLRFKVSVWEVLLFLAMGASGVWAERRGVVLYNILSWLVVWGGARYVMAKKVEMWVGRGLVIALLYLLVLAGLQMVTGHSIGGGWWWLGERTFSLATAGIADFRLGGREYLRPYGTFSHPNALGGFALVSLVLVAGSSLEKKWKWAGVASGAVLVILSWSQVAWAGLILWAVATWWLGRVKWGSERMRRIVVAVGFGGLILGGTLSLFGQDWIGMGGGDLSWERRKMLAEAAVQIWSEVPVRGVGLGNFLVELAPVLPKRETVYFLQPVHNGWLLLLAELGLLGGLIIGRGVVKLVRRGIIYGGRGELVALFLAGWLLTWDHYFLTLQQNQLLLGIVVGMVVRREENG